MAIDADMKVGDKVTRIPTTFFDPDRVKGEARRRPMTGRVVYIHPKGRFYTVEFDLPFGYKVRECFSDV